MLTIVLCTVYCKNKRRKKRKSSALVSECLKIVIEQVTVRI